MAENRGGHSFLILPTGGGEPVDLGSGRVVEGTDNVTFGHWNALVAWSPKTRSYRMIPAHGGEIVPGRLADHIAALSAGIRDGRPHPVQLDLDITMACASACTFCFSAGYRSVGGSGLHLSWPALERTVRSAAGMGVRVVRFDGGGDPLVSPHFAAAVDLCRQLGLTSAVLTAGDLLRPELLLTLVRACTYVRVSLNAATDRTRMLLHRTPRLGVTSLLRMLAELDRLRRAEHGPAPLAVMPLGGTSMIHPTNVAEIYAIAAAAKTAGLDHVSFRVVLGDRLRVAFTAEQEDNYRRQVDRIRTELVDDEFQVFFPTRSLTDTGYVPREYFSTCLASTQRALVEVGSSPSEPALVPCGRYRGQGFAGGAEGTVFGRMTGDDGLDDIWWTPRMTSLVQRFPGECGDCIDRSANIMFNGIHEALTADPDTAFFRFADP
ncbi:radical SAM protein [Micromonospora sp. NPDC005215]|uniref:radical SAM protein n=1 Tax=Micromonospora sp. NPDC005215 TaxID=3157024 RepID=UPI0033A295D4